METRAESTALEEALTERGSKAFSKSWPQWRGEQIRHWIGASLFFPRLATLVDSRLIRGSGRLRHLARAIELVWHVSPPLMLAHAVLMLALGVLPVASFYFLKLLIDALANVGGGGADWMGIAPLLVLAGSTAVIIDWLRAIDTYVSELQSHRVASHISELLHRQSVRLDLSYYESPEFYEDCHSAQFEAQHRPTQIVHRLINVTQNIVLLAGVAALLIAFQWKLTICVFLAMLPILAFRVRSARLHHRGWRDQIARVRKSQYLSYLISHRDHAKEVRLFDLGGYLHEQFVRLQQSIRRDQRSLAWRRTIGEGITQSCASLAVFGTLAYLGHEIVIKAVNIDELVVYYQALQRGQLVLREFFTNAAGLVEDSLFLANFYDFLLLEPKLTEPDLPRPMAYPLKEGIRFEAINFNYPHGKREALKSLSLFISAGETLAIVGRNGAGKTTLVKLLCRLHEPSGGHITVDGVDLRELSPNEWRKQIAVVLQDFGRYHFTARENIGVGDVTALETPDRIAAAAEFAGVAETIASLWRGYETPLGTLSPGAEDLSVGQWQQIAIARATLRDASIIVFDEPTSALDPRAEAELLKRVRSLASGRTAIIISHRLSSVSFADRIVVLDDGGVKESGTHAELMKLGGIYAGMFRAQADHYRFD